MERYELTEYLTPTFDLS